MSEKKRTWAAVGRTWGPFYYETQKEAYDMINSLPSKAVAYDGEVTIYHWDGDKWKEYESFGGYDEVNDYGEFD